MGALGECTARVVGEVGEGEGAVMPRYRIDIGIVNSQREIAAKIQLSQQIHLFPRYLVL